MRKYGTVIAISSLIVFAALPASGGSKYLTGAQLKATIVGKTLSYTGKTSGSNRISANGKSVVNDSKHGALTGRWWIKGNSWCRVYSKWPKTVKCLRFRKLGNGKLRITNGYTATVQ